MTTNHEPPDPEAEDLFTNNMPNDVVPHTKQPLDADTRRILREADETTAHIWSFRTAVDHEGGPLSAGWHHEGSGTLFALSELGQQPDEQGDRDDP